jgi:hypothetical protein
MAIPATAIPYGIRDLAVTPYTDATATVLGTKMDLPYIQGLSFTESEDFDTLTGDDTTVTSHGKGPAVDWETTSGGLNLAAYAVMVGGSVTQTGVTPNTVKSYRKLDSQTRPPFKIEGQVISDSGGDVHAVIHRSKVTGDVAGEFAYGAFYTPKLSGNGYGSLVPATLGALYDLVQNETAIAIA